jgi:hypothetical protein
MAGAWGAGLLAAGVLSKRAKAKAAVEVLHRDAVTTLPAIPPDTSGEEPESLERTYLSLLGARFRSEVLPVGVLTILGFGFSIILAIMTKSGFNEVLRLGPARLAESNPVAGDIFSGVHGSRHSMKPVFPRCA